MKNRISIMIVLLLVTTGIGWSQGTTDQQHGRIGFGPQVGFFKSQDSDGSRVMPGAALRIKLGGALGLEGSINYREEEFGNGRATVKSWPVMVTGLIYPIPRIYGAIGAGWYNTTIEYHIPLLPIADEEKQRFGWHFGGGVEIPMGNVASLVGDIRYVFLDYDFQHFPGTNGTNANFYVISVGLLFGI